MLTHPVGHGKSPHFSQVDCHTIEGESPIVGDQQKRSQVTLYLLCHVKVEYLFVVHKLYYPIIITGLF